MKAPWEGVIRSGIAWKTKVYTKRFITCLQCIATAKVSLERLAKPCQDYANKAEETAKKYPFTEPVLMIRHLGLTNTWVHSTAGRLKTSSRAANITGTQLEVLRRRPALAWRGCVRTWRRKETLMQHNEGKWLTKGFYLSVVFCVWKIRRSSQPKKNPKITRSGQRRMLVRSAGYRDKVTVPWVMLGSRG